MGRLFKALHRIRVTVLEDAGNVRLRGRILVIDPVYLMPPACDAGCVGCTVMCAAIVFSADDLRRQLAAALREYSISRSPRALDEARLLQDHLAGCEQALQRVRPRLDRAPALSKYPQTSPSALVH